MPDLEWLDGYGGQSTEELIAFEGRYRTDSIVLAFEDAIQQKAARVGDASLSNAERVVLAVEALEREVNNGGYSQFFVNPSKEFAPIIVDALNAIGRPEIAALTRRAIDILGIPGAITVEAVNRAMEKKDDRRDDRLDACDDGYFGAAGDLSGPLLAFIKANKGKIILKEYR